jgi:hypothetical protein
VIRTPHNHFPSDTDIVVRERKEQLKTQAKEQQGVAPRGLIGI